MRTKSYVFLSLLLAFIMFFAGCGGGGGDGGGGNGGGNGGGIPFGTMTAKVDGSSFSSIVALCTNSGSRVVIEGWTDDGWSIPLTVEIPASLPVTYNIKSSNADGNVIIVLDFDSSVEYFAIENSGKVTITELNDEKCQGIFEFKAEDNTGQVITVTDGNFNVPNS